MLRWNEETQQWEDDSDTSTGSGESSTDFWSRITSGIGNLGWSDISKLFAGTSPFGKAGSIVAAGGVSSLLNKLFDNSGSSGYAGYSGGIPTYTASREQTPIAQQRPTGYRPGQGGITYFTPMRYLEATPAPTAPATTSAPTATPAPTSSAGAGAAGNSDDSVHGTGRAARGGIMTGMAGGGRFLRGPGDGVSDSIDARFDGSGQPARLADGEFVIDARTVSEIGNGSSEAGARKLYAMLDRVHRARKAAGRGTDSKADKYLPK